MFKSKEELLERAIIHGWKVVSSDSDLTEEFIEEYLDKLDLYDIFYCNSISYDFVDRNWNFFRDKIDFLFDFSDINQNIVEKHISDFSLEHWKRMGKYVKNLSEEFIKEHENKLDMAEVFMFQKLSLSFIKDIFIQEKYKKNWPVLLSTQKYYYLTNEFILNYTDKFLSDYNISRVIMTHYDMPEYIIEKYMDCFIKTGEIALLSPHELAYGLVGDISYRQKLSENFMRKYKNYLNWFNISKCQKLSEDFIYEMEDYISCYYSCLKNNKQILLTSFHSKLGSSILIL